MPTNRRYVRHARRGRLNHAEEMTLIYGPDPRWDAFDTDEEARTAWAQHRERLLGGAGTGAARWLGGRSNRRSHFRDTNINRRRYRGRLLEPEERAALVEWWRDQFERAWEPHFFHCEGPGRFLRASQRGRRHSWADIPRESVKEWTSERRRRERTIGRLAKAVTQAAAVDEPVTG